MFNHIARQLKASLTFFIGGLLSAACCFAAESQWVHAGPDGKLVYKTTARGDRIMDFSSAGYMGGGVALPNVPVKRTVKPSGGPDDTAAIQEAIDAVAAMPLNNGFRGAVLLAAGTYTCSSTIYLSADGVVLRGSGATGPAASTIKMTGAKHCAIVAGRSGGRRGAAARAKPEPPRGNQTPPLRRQSPMPMCRPARRASRLPILRAWRLAT